MTFLSFAIKWQTKKIIFTFNNNVTLKLYKIYNYIKGKNID